MLACGSRLCPTPDLLRQEGHMSPAIGRCRDPLGQLVGFGVPT